MGFVIHSILIESVMGLQCVLSGRDVLQIWMVHVRDVRNIVSVP